MAVSGSLGYQALLISRRTDQMKLSMQQINYLEQLNVQYATQEDHDGDCQGGDEGDVNIIQGSNGDEIIDGGAGRDDILGGNGQDVLHFTG